MDNGLYVEINGKMAKFRPASVEDIPIFERDETIERVREGGEATFSVKTDGSLEKFIEQMRNEFSVVDITDWPASVIKKLIATIPNISKFVTRNPQHYQYLQTEDGYVCVAGDYDTLFGVPVVLDKKGKIKAAQIGFEKKGGDSGGNERN